MIQISICMVFVHKIYFTVPFLLKERSFFLAKRRCLDFIKRTILCYGYYDYKIKKGTRLSSYTLEATIGFEPMNQGVADPRLTAWLCRHIKLPELGSNQQPHG